MHDEQIALIKRDNIWSLTAAIVVLALVVIGQVLFYNTSDDNDQTTVEPPSADLAENRTWTGNLTISDVPLEVELFGDLAPQTVSSFVHLTSENFFDNTVCHRLTTYDTMQVLQCGDPNGEDPIFAGIGGPDYRFGPIENAPVDTVYQEGVLAMARASNNANSQGSQFFIVLSESQIPNDSAGGYTIFGKVVTGLEQLISDVTGEGVEGDGQEGRPKTEARIQEFEIR